jgi:hypothetical protein
MTNASHSPGQATLETPRTLDLQSDPGSSAAAVAEQIAALRQNRAYKVSLLPTLRDDASAPSRETVLLALYQQVTSTWHHLIDIRFKLLGAVPTVSILLLATLLKPDEPAKSLSPVVKTGIALLGLLATVGLFIYDRRNSALHDDLISRGRRIEDELGVDTGQFRGRLKTEDGSPVRHGVATNLVYGSAITGWFAALWAIWERI